jgi:hypothetical protein
MSKLPFEDGDVVCLKAMALYLARAPDCSLELSKSSKDDSCHFTMVHKGGKYWAFQSLIKGTDPFKKYITVHRDGSVLCTAIIPTSEATFLLIGSDPRHVLFENQSNKQYLRSRVESGQPVGKLRCADRITTEGEAYFEIERQ